MADKQIKIVETIQELISNEIEWYKKQKHRIEIESIGFEDEEQKKEYFRIVGYSWLYSIIIQNDFNELVNKSTNIFNSLNIKKFSKLVDEEIQKTKKDLKKNKTTVSEEQLGFWTIVKKDLNNLNK